MKQGVLFRKCDCGREFKILYLPNDRKQRYTCECELQDEVDGTIMEIHWCIDDSFVGKHAEWIRLSTRRIEDVE